MQAFEPGRTLPAKTVDFWFDYTCPYAYLGSTRAQGVAARMGAKLTYRPLLLGGVFRACGTPQELFATLSPAKAAHNGEDMQRWARKFGVVLKMPASHPMRSVDALRATLATQIDPAVVDAFYRAYWVENANIADRGVVRAVVESCGHDGARVMAAIDTAAVKDDLRKRTDEAIALGIFGVPSWVVDGEHLYWGQDRIRFVEGLRRDAEPAAKPARAATLDVYWDFSSPFAYLGATQIARVAERTGAKVTWRPVLLGGLFRAIGSPDVPLATFSQAKQKYIAKDLERWAAYLGVPYRFPSRFPVMTLKALRVYFALPEEARGAYRDAVFKAIWADDRDLGDDAVLASCVPGGEAAARDALARAGSDEVKAALREATEHAQKEGVFGVPTFVTHGARGRELHWGQDRLDLVEEALATEA
ncbi:MAG: 2-hydroxychromene-2-carboxylate isomerase [Labilithrix sp.]|nr:2-hydroxychromene-2-carboxylate isomerase [Labilithrix sp.]